MRFPHISFLRNDASGICGRRRSGSFSSVRFTRASSSLYSICSCGSSGVSSLSGWERMASRNGCVHPGVPSTGGIGYARPHTNSFLSYETIVTVPFPSKTHRIILVRSLPQYPFFRLCWLQTYKEAYNTDGILVQKL